MECRRLACFTIKNEAKTKFCLVFLYLSIILYLCKTRLRQIDKQNGIKYGLYKKFIGTISNAAAE